jgi:hypothetical protein
VEHFVSSHTDSRLHKYSRILYIALSRYDSSMRILKARIFVNLIARVTAPRLASTAALSARQFGGVYRPAAQRCGSTRSACRGTCSSRASCGAALCDLLAVRSGGGGADGASRTVARGASGAGGPAVGSRRPLLRAAVPEAANAGARRVYIRTDCV